MRRTRDLWFFFVDRRELGILIPKVTHFHLSAVVVVVVVVFFFFFNLKLC